VLVLVLAMVVAVCGAVVVAVKTTHVLETFR
jgi:hypothetical protein